VRVPGDKVREMGLGSASVTGFAAARTLADDARKLAATGIDPVVQRQSERVRAAIERARTMTFKQCAEAYMTAHSSAWRNPKHKQQWANTLANYAYPILGNLPVQAIDVALVMKVLDPIWSEKTETATRLRGRIEAVLDWAAVRGLREGENPARWRGHLQKAFPVRSKVQRVQHHAALPYTELPAFMADLREKSGVAARALEFLVLTAARTSEVLGATWPETDLDLKLWTIPPERMKAGREHRVPLSGAALRILRGLYLKQAQPRIPGFSAALHRASRSQAWRCS
jgi:integrase